MSNSFLAVFTATLPIAGGELKYNDVMRVNVTQMKALMLRCKQIVVVTVFVLLIKLEYGISLFTCFKNTS